MKRLFVPVCIAAAIAAGSTVSAADPPRFTIIDLGRVSDGEPYPHAISNTGRIVLGERDRTGVDRGFVWDKGVITMLPPLAGTARCIARAISDTGVIGGSSGPFSDLSATTWVDGEPRFAGTLGGTLSDIMHLSENGNSTGYSRPFTDQGLWHGFAVIGGVMHDIGPMPMYDNSAGFVINDSGRVAGAWTNHQGRTVPFIWDVEHGIRELPTLGGVEAIVNDINNSGQIVGYAGDGRVDAGTPFLVRIPVRWEPDGRITRLAMLPDRPTGEAFGINARGDAVGRISNATTSGAALWLDSSVFKLQDVIPSGSGWTLLVASDINDAGQIVGQGTLDGRNRAFLLQPE